MTLEGTMQVDENGHLFIGGCDTTLLVEHFGTPLFVYDEAYIRDRIREFHEALRESGFDYEISYASKAFCSLAMCQLVAEEGCAIDVVSGGELYTALKAGVPADRIHLHGNNKTTAELEYAVEAGIGAIIVDNFVELRTLQTIAERQQKVVTVLFRIAPGIEAHTHEYISTGQQDSKFGFDMASGQAHEAINVVSTLSNIRVVGLHSHIGSQIFDSQGFLVAIDRLAELFEYGVSKGLPFHVFNIGGGFGIRYTSEDNPPSIRALMAEIVSGIQASFTKRNFDVPTIWLEPGRSIVGPAGITLYTVGTKKVIPDVRNYVAVDGGMTDNPRYALYGARYEAILANRALDARNETWSVAGKCCESGDMLIRDLALPEPQPGDIMAVFATGAYNYSMVSHYNRLPHPAVVFVRDGKAAVVVERETWADVARLDKPLAYHGGDSFVEAISMEPADTLKR